MSILNHGQTEAKASGEHRGLGHKRLSKPKMDKKSCPVGESEQAWSTGFPPGRLPASGPESVWVRVLVQQEAAVRQEGD